MRQRTVDAARGRWISVLGALGVGEEFLRNRHGPCPFCGGTDRYRFDDKEGNGTWFCNSCGTGRGIEFVMQRFSCDYKEACAKVDAVVGNAKMVTTQAKKDPKPMLRKIWSESVVSEKGGIVDTYLHGRGLTLTGSTLREHKGIRYYDGHEVVGTFEAMVAPVTNKDGSMYALHYTYLQGGKKINRDPAKKLSPRIAEKISSPAIRLFPVGEVMAISEGIETALAYNQLYGISCWAAVSSGLMVHWEPPEGVEKVIIAADNDESFAGHQASGALAFKLNRMGYEVEIDMPNTRGFDWCDVVNFARLAGNK